MQASSIYIVGMLGKYIVYGRAAGVPGIWNFSTMYTAATIFFSLLGFVQLLFEDGVYFLSILKSYEHLL